MIASLDYKLKKKNNNSQSKQNVQILQKSNHKQKINKNHK